MQGIIVKGISGFYYVRSEGNIYECKAKGVFRKKGITPLVGDRVSLSINEDGSGTIGEILPRLNFFERPPLANVECFVLVAAFKDPLPSFLMLDRFAVMAEKSNAKLILCVNKEDLADEKQKDEFKKAYGDVYEMFFISALNSSGIEDLKKALCGKQCALAGPSGVGKSTLTNALLGSDISKTGDISHRLMRGKNTTRHSELFEGDGFYIFDTPGFTSFEAVLDDEYELASLFPEFNKYLGQCRFSDCVHLNEPDCSIRAAVESGCISESRYESYKDIFASVRKAKEYGEK